MYSQILICVIIAVCPLIGYILRWVLPKYVVHYAYQFIVWVGTPLLVISSVRVSGLVSELWIVPIISLIAIVLGAAFSLIAIDLRKLNERILVLLSGSINRLHTSSDSNNKPSQQYSAWSNSLDSSFMIGGMLSNTSYIAFPIIILSLASDRIQDFIWAVIFDLCVSLFGLCAIPLTAYFIHKHPLTINMFLNPLQNIFSNKIFWSLIIGILLSTLNFSDELKSLLNQTRYLVVPLCLMAVGMQINLPKTGVNTQRLSSYNLQNTKLSRKRNQDNESVYPIFNEYFLNSRSINQSAICLVIKMFLVPLVMAAFILSLNIKNLPVTVVMLQIAMPPLLISSDISKHYNLYQDFNIAINSFGCILLVAIVPLFLVLFNSN